MIASPSSSDCTPKIPSASMPSSGGRTGRAPVAITRSSYPSSPSSPSPSTARKDTTCFSRSTAVASVRMRRSMPASRCCSGDRAMRSSPSGTVPAIQYGIPQAEYEV